MVYTRRAHTRGGTPRVRDERPAREKLWSLCHCSAAGRITIIVLSPLRRCLLRSATSDECKTRTGAKLYRRVSSVPRPRVHAARPVTAGQNGFVSSCSTTDRHFMTRLSPRPRSLGRFRFQLQVPRSNALWNELLKLLRFLRARSRRARHSKTHIECICCFVEHRVLSSCPRCTLGASRNVFRFDRRPSRTPYACTSRFYEFHCCPQSLRGQIRTIQS